MDNFHSLWGGNCRLVFWMAETTAPSYYIASNPSKQKHLYSIYTSAFLTLSYQPGLVTWGYQVRIRVGTDICHRRCAYTVLQTVQIHGVHSAAYGTAHYKEPLKSFEIRVGHSPGFGLPSVAILPWLCRKRREMKWNESGFRPPLCTYRLNWARRTSWGWWDDWDDTVLQTQDSKFEPWRSEAEHTTFRSRRLPTILTFTRGWGRNIFCFFQTAETGNRTPNSGVKGSGANHYPRAPAQKATWNNIHIHIQLYNVGPTFSTLIQHCINVLRSLGWRTWSEVQMAKLLFCLTSDLSWRRLAAIWNVPSTNGTRQNHTLVWQCNVSRCDADPTLKQHWFYALCLLGYGLRICDSANDIFINTRSVNLDYGFENCEPRLRS